MNRQELENRVWYRCCKLCYGFAYVIALSFAVALGYTARPVEYIDSDESIIVCANGSSHSAREISGYFSSSELNSYADEKARQLCSGFEEKRLFEKGGWVYRDNLTGEVLPPGVIPLERNSVYTFIPIKGVRGGYGTILWGLGIVVLVGEIIRRSFLYVVAGIPFFDFPILRKGFRREMGAPFGRSLWFRLTGIRLTETEWAGGWRSFFWQAGLGLGGVLVAKLLGLF